MGPIIVACTDFSACSGAAVAQAAEIARLCRGRVLLIHVCEPPTRKERSMDTWNVSAIRKLSAERRDRFRDFSDNDVQYDAVAGLEPASTICKVAREHDAAMVVVGSHGRTGVSRRLLGSVAENVVRHAPCSVLVARAAGIP